MNETVPEMRDQLIYVMEAVSEAEWAAEWYGGIQDVLLRRGGIWEVLGRAVGWPVGAHGYDGWISWNEAVAALTEEQT